MKITFLLFIDLLAWITLVITLLNVARTLTQEYFQSILRHFGALFFHTIQFSKKFEHAKLTCVAWRECVLFILLIDVLAWTTLVIALLNVSRTLTQEYLQSVLGYFRVFFRDWLGSAQLILFSWSLVDIFTRVLGITFCVFMLRIYSPILIVISLAVRLYYASRVIHPWKYQR